MRLIVTGEASSGKRVAADVLKKRFGLDTIRPEEVEDSPAKNAIRVVRDGRDLSIDRVLFESSFAILADPASLKTIDASWRPRGPKSSLWVVCLRSPMETRTLRALRFGRYPEAETDFTAKDARLKSAIEAFLRDATRPGGLPELVSRAWAMETGPTRPQALEDLIERNLEALLEKMQRSTHR